MPNKSMKDKAKTSLLWISQLVAVVGLFILFIKFVYVPLSVTIIKQINMLMQIEGINLSKAEIGDTLMLGYWEQDDDDSNGEERIEWQIVDIQDDKLLLVSKCGLVSKQYHDKDFNQPVQWADCTLRKWLNEDFIKKAFNGAIRRKIAETTVKGTVNSQYGTKTGADTVDKIFLLSAEEVEKYFPWEEQRISMASLQVIFNSNVSDTYGRGYWWLRTAGAHEGRAAYVRSLGSIMYDGHNVYRTRSVRPAMWLEVN